MSGRGPFTVDPREAEALLSDPSTRFVDASWYLPAHDRDARAEFDRVRIPGAVFFDIDRIADRASPFPHMLPSPGEFALAVGQLGIANDDKIVVYDGPGLFSSARAWWMFRVMGAKNVRVLDGGFDRWKTEGRPVETGLPRDPTVSNFEPAFDPEAVFTIDQVRENLRRGTAIVLDARPFPRFAGQMPEPRAGLRAGHIPGSRSLPYSELVEEGRLKNLEDLQALFSGLALEPDRMAVTTCGSGVTAAVISLALASIGHDLAALYDGSWAEWGQADDAPVAKWEEGENGGP